MVNRLFQISVALAVFLALMTVDVHPVWAQQKQKATFALSWISTGAAASFFAAKGKGFFDEEGLDVAIVRGYGSADTVTRVDQGRAEFGEIATVQIIISRAKGAKVKLVGMYQHNNPNAVIFRTDSGIRAPKDLEGKKVGGFAAGATQVLFPAFAKANGIDMKKVKFINLGPGTFAASLASKVVDALLDFLTAYPSEQKAVREAGGDTSYMLFSDHGVSLYGNGLATSDKLVVEKPDMIRRLVRATIRGMAWAADHPEETIDIFMKLNPQFADRGEPIAAFRIAGIQLLADEYTSKQGIGYIVEEKLKRTMEIVVDAFDIKSMPLGEVYSNQFLEDIPRDWRFPKTIKR